MNIKEIVEGMTAPQVAQVIKDNFNEVDKDKANKTELNKSISDLASVVEANKTELTEKIDNDKDETDAKLSELGSEVEGLSGERGLAVTNPAKTSNCYILDGVITSLSGQNTFFIRVKKDDTITVSFDNSTSTTVRWGMFDSFPKLGDTTKTNGQFYATASFKYKALVDGYFACSVYGLTPTFNLQSKRTELLESSLKSIDELNLNLMNLSSYVGSPILNGGIEIEGQYYINNGTISSIAATQVTKYFKVNEGDNIAINLLVQGTFRYAFYNEVPIVGSSSDLYGQSVNDFNVVAPISGYFAYSMLDSMSVELSFNGIIQEIGKIKENHDAFENKILGETRNLIKSFETGVYLTATGSKGYNEAYIVTDFIPLDESVGYLVSSVDGAANNKSSGACIVGYDSEFKFVKSLGSLIEANGIAVWEEGISYVKFSIGNYGNPRVQVEKGTVISEYIYPYKINSELLPTGKENALIINPYRIEKELIAGEAIYSPNINYIRKNNIITANIESVNGFDSVIFGVGKDDYRGYWVEITSNTINVTSATDNYNQSIEHSIDLSSGRFNAIIEVNDDTTASIRLQSKGNQAEYKINKWVGGGPVFATNNGNTTKFVSVTHFPKDSMKNIWGYGDSYFSYNDRARWTYYLLDWGYKNNMLDHLPGARSSKLFECLKNDLNLGSPEYVLWCLGMNDNGDVDSPDTTWLSIITQVISICKSRNIIPVLSTIPSVPNKSHEYKNEWIRNSGYRYIDFAKAVNAGADGVWENGMLSSDNVHPTSIGAIALAARATSDFPELSY